MPSYNEGFAKMLRCVKIYRLEEPLSDYIDRVLQRRDHHCEKCTGTIKKSCVRALHVYLCEHIGCGGAFDSLRGCNYHKPADGYNVLPYVRSHNLDLEQVLQQLHDNIMAPDTPDGQDARARLAALKEMHEKYNLEGQLIPFVWIPADWDTPEGPEKEKPGLTRKEKKKSKFQSRLTKLAGRNGASQKRRR